MYAADLDVLLNLTHHHAVLAELLLDAARWEREERGRPDHVESTLMGGESSLGKRDEG